VASSPDELSERFLNYGVLIIRLCEKLRRSPTGRRISDQLLDAGTSSGANYEEARAAQSRADFVHKLQIVLKELRESLYWLRLIQRSRILESPELEEAITETRELASIIGKSVITAKRAQ
jgi:four helix bundle protein